MHAPEDLNSLSSKTDGGGRIARKVFGFLGMLVFIVTIAGLISQNTEEKKEAAVLTDPACDKKAVLFYAPPAPNWTEVYLPYCNYELRTFEGAFRVNVEWRIPATEEVVALKSVSMTTLGNELAGKKVDTEVKFQSPYNYPVKVYIGFSPLP